MAEQKRVRRTSEQIAADLDVEIQQLETSITEIEEKKAASAAEFDKKISNVREKISKMQDRKKALLTPKKRRPRRSKADQIKEIVKQAQKKGMKPDEIADKLGIEREALN